MAAARLMAVVVLPTPPFWLATVRMAVIECPARFYGRARASLGRWVANPPAWLSVPFRLPGPKPFGCQQSNRVRMATQAKNVQRINNKSARGPLRTRFLPNGATETMRSGLRQGGFRTSLRPEANRWASLLPRAQLPKKRNCACPGAAACARRKLRGYDRRRRRPYPVVRANKNLLSRCAAREVFLRACAGRCAIPPRRAG